MTIKFLFLAFLAICTFNANSQSNTYFEGTIRYKYTFKADKIPDADKLLMPYFGQGSILYFKEGNYRHEYDGGLMEYDLYNKKNNKFYFKKRNNDTLFYSDCSTRGDSILNFVHTPKADTIMKIICDRLVIKYKDKTETHYYNSESISINPEWFKNFKRDDEYLIDKKEKSIFLKSENVFEYFTLIGTAENINVKSVDLDKFKLPPNAILLPSEL